MRLLNVDTYKLEDFFYTDPPPYAILSHTWGSDHEEVSYRDVLNGRLDSEATRPQKVSGCCAMAKAEGYQYVWIDTCCIDNTNLVELTEAINSMFRWYQEAAVCYAYLSDVLSSNMFEDKTKTAFSSSRWFTRGWTLQELLAPWNLRFYNRDWECLGTKGDLCNLVEEITGIPSTFLVGLESLDEASVAQRMSWAAKRVTKRQEDIAYCLLGIFGVTMPLIYGEKEKAFRRLQEQIMKETGDDSILAWDFDLDEEAAQDVSTPVPGQLLAQSPSAFANCGKIRAIELPIHSLELQGGALRLPLTIHTQPGEGIVGFLKCFDETDIDLRVAIPLVPAPGVGTGYFRDMSRRVRPVQTKNLDPSPPAVYLHVDPKYTVNARKSHSSWFHIQNSVTTLELIAVYPASCWHKERSVIELPKQGTANDLQQVLARFRPKSNGTKDLLLAFHPWKLGYGLVVVERETTMEEMTKYTDWWSVGKDRVCIGSENLAMGIQPTPGSRSDSRFVVALKRVNTSIAPGYIIDATAKLRGLEAEKLLNEIKHGFEAENDKVRELLRQKRDAQSQLAAYQTEIEHVRREIERLRKQESTLLEQYQSMERSVMELDHQLNQAGANDSERQAAISTLNQIVYSSRGNDDEDKENDNRAQVDDKEHERPDKTLAKSIKRKLFQMAREQGYSALARHLLETILSEPWALRAAAENGYVDLVQSLLDEGVYIDDADENGRTALHHASRERHEKIVDLLLRHGATPRRVDRDTKRPSDVACSPEAITSLYRAMFLNERSKTEHEGDRARELEKATEKTIDKGVEPSTDKSHSELLNEMTYFSKDVGFSSHALKISTRTRNNTSYLFRMTKARVFDNSLRLLP